MEEIEFSQWLFESRHRPKICGKYFLLFSQKNLWPEKTEIAKCLLFNFWVIKLTKTPILPNYHVAKWLFSVNFITQKLKCKHLAISVFSGQRYFWGNERKYFPHTGGPPLTWKSLTRFPLPWFLASVRVSGGVSVSRGPQHSSTNTNFM